MSQQRQPPGDRNQKLANLANRLGGSAPPSTGGPEGEPPSNSMGQWFRNVGQSIKSSVDSDLARGEDSVLRCQGSRLLRFCGRMALVAGAHLVPLWFLSHTWQNLLGLLIAIAILVGMLGAFLGKTFAKSTGGFLGSIANAIWAAYLKLWLWGLGIKQKKQKKKEDDDD